MYIVDFYCPKLRLVVEVDGISHFFPGQPERDARRQRWLEEKGMRIIRFDALNVINYPEEILEMLKIYIKQLSIGHSPRPTKLKQRPVDISS